MPMGPDPNPNTASAIGLATMARLGVGVCKNERFSSLDFPERTGLSEGRDGGTAAAQAVPGRCQQSRWL